MLKVKQKNIKLYQRLRQFELTEKDVIILMNSTKKKVQENEKGQYQLFEE